MAKPVQYHDGRFPPESLEWKQLIPLIGPANAVLAFSQLLNIAEGHKAF